MHRTADEEAAVSRAVQRILELVNREIGELPDDLQGVVLERLPDDLSLLPVPRGTVRARRPSRLGLSDDALLRVAKDMDEEPTELEKGTEVESEHAATYQKIKTYYETEGEWPSEEQVFEWIASDHIDNEDEHYYTEILLPAEEAAKKSS
jgi:hypothetical protein